MLPSPSDSDCTLSSFFDTYLLLFTSSLFTCLDDYLLHFLESSPRFGAILGIVASLVNYRCSMLLSHDWLRYSV